MVISFCEKNLNSNDAFRYLEVVASSFFQEYLENKISQFSDQYACLEFQADIGKISKNLVENQTKFQKTVNPEEMEQINQDLSDVKKIIVNNIDDILQKNYALQEIEHKTQEMHNLTSKFRAQSSRLNQRKYISMTASFVIVLLLFLFVYFKFFR